MDLQQALAQLDPHDDDDWTANGLPRIGAVVGILGRETNRKQITDADPHLTRQSLLEQSAEPELVEPVAVEPPPPVVVESPAVPAPVEYDAAYVPPEDDVVGMDQRTVYASVDLIDRALAEFERQSTILAKRRDAVLLKLKELGHRSLLLDRERNRLLKRKPADKQGEQTRAYFARQHEERMRRAEAAKKLAEAGVTAKDLQNLGGPSPLDRALSNRKPGRGTGRPQYPLPKQVG